MNGRISERKREEIFIQPGGKYLLNMFFSQPVISLCFLCLAMGFLPGKYDLSERLLLFATEIITIAEAFPQTSTGNHLRNQLIRSATSPALHYGEAQAAESRADFIHKMKICLKELRESMNCLRLAGMQNWRKHGRHEHAVNENNELLAIFVSSIKTATTRQHSKNKSAKKDPFSD